MKIGQTIFIYHPEMNNQIKSIDSIGKNRIRIIGKETININNNKLNN